MGRSFSKPKANLDVIEPEKHSLALLLLKYAIVLSGVFLLEITPITAIFGMLLGIVLWLSLIVNAMLVHIAFTAFYPGSSRFRLLIPLTVYSALLIGIAITRAMVIERAHAYEAANNLSEPVWPETDLVFEDILDWALIRSVALLSPKRRVFDKQYRLVVQEASPLQSCFNPDAIRSRGARDTLGPLEQIGGSSLHCVDRVEATINGPSVHLSQNRSINLFGLEDQQNAAYDISAVDENGQYRKIGQFRSGKLGLPPFTIIYSAGCLPKFGPGSLACGIASLPSSTPIYFGADGDAQAARTTWEPQSQTRARALVKMLNGKSAP